MLMCDVNAFQQDIHDENVTWFWVVSGWADKRSVAFSFAYSNKLKVIAIPMYWFAYFRSNIVQ